MSVQSEITRIQDNVTAALAAIADKGVTVPDGSTSDALATLIASIEAGGGSTNKAFNTYTYIPASNSSYGPYLNANEINGEPPAYVFAQYVPEESVTATKNNYIRSVFLERTSFDGINATYKRYITAYVSLESSRYAPHVTTMTYDSGTFYFTSGALYTWGASMEYRYIVIW